MGGASPHLRTGSTVSGLCWPSLIYVSNFDQLPVLRLWWQLFLCLCTILQVFWLERCSVVTVGSAVAFGPTAFCPCDPPCKSPSEQEGRRSAHASSRPKTRLGVRQNTVQRVCNTPLLLLVCRKRRIQERLLG